MNANLIVEILKFAAVLASLIILHELGHFFAARLLKVDVEEFGLGYPPRAVTLFTAKGTQFSLNWLPFGGFVRLKGENDPGVDNGFASKNPWVRIGTLVAGPFSNLLIGAILYAIIFSQIGVPVYSQVKIFDVVPGSPAAMAGLLSGDVITRVDQNSITGTDSVQSAISAKLDQPTILVVQRDGQEITVTLVPRSNPPEGQGAIGITMGNPSKPVGIIQAIPMGFMSVVQQGQQLLAFPVKLITGQIAPSEGRLVGLKGMFDIYQVVSTSETAAEIPPYVNILGFIATISISFGVINLLPIPALDGGRILFVLPELITGKRIPPKYENVINMVSFALLIMLMIFVNIQDFLNPISLP